MLIFQNSSLRAKIKELEDATLQVPLAGSPNPTGEDIVEDSVVSKDTETAARIVGQLNNLKERLNEYVTKPLEVPEVNQDQLETPVKLKLLSTLTESLQMIYTRTLTMVTETCKCSEDVRREFYDFAYHGLRAEHNELTHRVEDLELALPQMSEEEKKEFERLKRYQDNQQRQVERLDRLWKGLFSPVSFYNLLSWEVSLRLSEPKGSVGFSKNLFIFLRSCSRLSSLCQLQPNSPRLLFIIYSFPLFSIVRCHPRLGRIFHLITGFKSIPCRPYTRGRMPMLADANTLKSEISKRTIKKRPLSILICGCTTNLSPV